MSSPLLVISCAEAKPTHESLLAASSKASQSKVNPVAPCIARQNRQRVELTAHAESCAPVVDGDGMHFPWNIPISGSVVAPQVLASASLILVVAFAIFCFASAVSAPRIAAWSCAADVTAGPLLPLRAALAAPCISFH